MKKWISIFMAAVLLTGCFVGCGKPAAEQSERTSERTDWQTGKGIQIVTTIFPEYDWVRTVLGESQNKAEVTLLLDNGADLHSYQPTAADIMKISSCDLFVYVGGESDAWVEDALQEALNKNMIVLNLLNILGDRVKDEEIVAGMQEENEEEEEEAEYDEHVWLSLKNAMVICDEIATALSQLDPQGAEQYVTNASAYKEQLSQLDEQYQSAVASAPVKTVLFGDRFPFRYLTDDYGLDYYAAFVGCSAETEASFETIIFLANKTDELGLSAILTLEGDDHRLAETIRDNTASKTQQILSMDSLQSVTSKEVESGTTYLSVMQYNLEILKEALQ